MASSLTPASIKRERDGRTGAAGADQQRALSFRVAAMGARRADEAEAVDDVAVPTAMRTSPHHVDSPEKTGALARASAMLVASELVRDGDNDAVEVLDARGGAQEGREVLGRDLNRNQDRVLAALLERARVTPAGDFTWAIGSPMITLRRVAPLSGKAEVGSDMCFSLVCLQFCAGASACTTPRRRDCRS